MVHEMMTASCDLSEEDWQYIASRLANWALRHMSSNSFMVIIARTIPNSLSDNMKSAEVVSLRRNESGRTL